MPGEDSWDIPGEVLVTPVPLIALLGLNVSDGAQPEHRAVWEMFSSNRGLDRHALNYSVLDLDSLEFPVCKPPRTSYEWYLPRGVLKRNWISKHLNQLPSVIVLFFSNPTLASVSSVVGKVKLALAGRQTKMAVVLLQESADQDTITSICTECSIPVRAVVCLPFSSSSTSSHLKTVLEFEETLQELSSNYYHAQIKTVKSHRDHLNKATHLHLLVRHSFKIGFLSELKGEPNTAYKSLLAAYLLLLESRLTEHNSSELRSVAGIINYKICKLAFRLNLPLDAVKQLRRHLDQWRRPPGPAGLSWEQAAWQAAQARHFALLFSEACRAGQKAIQVEHPGVYYQLAAEYFISRRKLSDSLCSGVTTYPTPDPLEGLATLEYYGQRPWRSGKQEPSDLAKEKEGIEAMMFRERRVKHSQTILELLVQAGAQYEAWRCPRMKTKLTIQQAEEQMVMTDYKAALATLLPCLPTYRGEAWASLTYSVLSSALKCSFLSADLPSYVSLCLELAGLPSSAASWMAEEQRRVWANLLQLVETGKPPLPEPSLTAKSERASVGAATKDWSALLAADIREEIDISSFHSCLDVTVQLPPAVRSDQELAVNIALSYKGEGEITVRDVKCLFTDSKYDRGNILQEPLVLTEGTTKQLAFTINPHPSDVGKTIQVKTVSAVVGSRDCLQLVLVRSSPVREKEETIFSLTDRRPAWQSVCKVEPQEAKISVHVRQEGPALVGEWFRLSVELESGESEECRDISVSCSLRDRADPLLSDTTILSLAPQSPATPSSPTEEELHHVVGSLDSLAVSARDCVVMYLQASTSGERSLTLDLSYKAGQSQCWATQILSVNVVQPFVFATTYLSQALEETQDCNTDEEFFVSCAVRNVSDHDLVVLEATMEGCQPVTVLQPSEQFSDLQLGTQCTVEQAFSAMVPSKNMLPQLDSQTITPGKFVLSWTRKNMKIPNQTVFDLPSLKLSRATLYVSCVLPPYGVLRASLIATFTFHNRTQEVQELLVNTEPSDSFMFSGPKQSQIKLFPLDSYQLRLVLYPLVCGMSPLPKLKISTSEGSAAQVNLYQIEAWAVFNDFYYLIFLSGRSGEITTNMSDGGS